MSHSKFLKKQERIDELEKQLADTQVVLDRSRADIRDYNDCIASVISGEKTYCDWCEDLQECQRECKGKGCSEWWLRYRKEDASDSETVFPAGGTRGTETIGTAGKITSF